MKYRRLVVKVACRVACFLITGCLCSCAEPMKDETPTGSKRVVIDKTRQMLRA